MADDNSAVQGRAFDHDEPVDYRSLFGWFKAVLGPESSYYWLAVIYGIAVSLLTLALPISVQMLIDTVANTGLVQPVIVLASVLFVLLFISGILVALRTHVMELFARRIYARLSAEIALRSTHAQVNYFLESKRDSQFNRFFDIMILQANVPSLLTGAFTLIFQSVIGFVLVSLYHPYFLVFTLVLVTCIFLVWLVWGRGAIRTAISESYAKFDTAANLERFAENNDFFRSEINLNVALYEANRRIAEYVRRNRSHFRYSFSQTLCLLLLYAIASALLLGIGGWLVIGGQLTLGQLVAAELILSTILLGMSQFGFYLDQFYEVCAAVEKLSAFFKIPLEDDPDGKDPPLGAPRIEFDQVVTKRPDGEPVSLALDIPAGSSVMVRNAQIPAQRAFLSLLQAYERPDSGWIRLGGQDLRDIDLAKLRAAVMVLDRTDIVDCSIDSFLDLANPNVTSAQKAEVLKVTGLHLTVHRLSKGITTPIVPSGWPLSLSETLRLKLAGALLKRPCVLVLTEIFDVVERRHLNPILNTLARDLDTTVIRFTDDEPGPWADYTLALHTDWQRLEHVTDGGTGE